MWWVRASGVALLCAGTLGLASLGPGKSAARATAPVSRRPRLLGAAGAEPSRFRVAALARGARSARFSNDCPGAGTLWAATAAPEAARPGVAPDWQVTVWRDGETKSLAVWSSQGVVREQGAGPAAPAHRVAGVGALLRGIPPVPPLPSRSAAIPPSRRETDGREPRFSRVAELDNVAEYILLGRVTGLVARYARDPADPTTLTEVYLIRVAGVVKAQREKQIDFIRLQWPVGLRGDGGAPAYPALRQGQDLILATSHAPREWVDASGAHTAWLGEQAVTAPMPYGAIGVENGKIVALDPAHPAPRIAFHFPQEIAFEGHPWQAFVHYLQWGLRPENRFSRPRPLPGTEGQLLVRPAPPVDEEGQG